MVVPRFQVKGSKKKRKFGLTSNSGDLFGGISTTTRSHSSKTLSSYGFLIKVGHMYFFGPF